MRVTLAPMLPEALAPVPVPVPAPEPPPPPPPAPRRRPVFPAPMDLSLGPAPGAGGPSGHGRIRGLGAFDPTPDASTRDTMGALARDVTAADSTIHVRGANLPESWIELLHEWWNQHGYYPDEAARRGEDGTVRMHVKVDRDGHVRMVELESTSGSTWIDAGALAVFRGQTVPPFPPGNTDQNADLDLTITYVIIRR